MNAFKTASTHPVSQIVFDPSGASFAIVQANYGVTVCNRAGQITATMPVPRVALFTGAVFFDEGTKLALGSRKGVHLFDVASGQLLAWCHGWDLVQPVIAVSGNAVIVLTQANFGKLGFLDGQVRRPSGNYLGGVIPVALAPDGSRAVIRTGTREDRLNVLEPFSVQVLGRLAHPAAVTNCVFAPDGSRLAVSDGVSVTVYDVPEHDSDSDDVPDPSLVQRAPKPQQVLMPVFQLGPPPKTILRGRWQPPVGFTPDGSGLFIRRPRNRVQFWDIATASHAGEWSWRMPTVTSLAVAPDGLTAAAGGRFGNVVLWDLE